MLFNWEKWNIIKKKMIALEVIDKSKKFDGDCCICLKKIDTDETITNCKHYFHKNCLNQWIEYNNICPVCRKELEIPALEIGNCIKIISFIISIIITLLLLITFCDIYHKSLIFIGSAVELFFYCLGKIIKIYIWILSFKALIYLSPDVLKIVFEFINFFCIKIIKKIFKWMEIIIIVSKIYLNDNFL